MAVLVTAILPLGIVAAAIATAGKRGK